MGDNIPVQFGQKDRRQSDSSADSPVPPGLNHGKWSDDGAFGWNPAMVPCFPLLANVLLDEVDKELEPRGHKFVRYTDDCNVYVRSRRASERGLQLLSHLYEKLHLKVNQSKTSVGPGFGRKLLGYCFRRWSNYTVKIAVAPKAIATFKQRIREITRRSGGRSLTQVAEQLRLYLPGWKSYFGLAQTPPTFKDLELSKGNASTAGDSIQALATRPHGLP